jgi:hypothetical protein
MGTTDDAARDGFTAALRIVRLSNLSADELSEAGKALAIKAFETHSQTLERALANSLDIVAHPEQFSEHTVQDVQFASEVWGNIHDLAKKFDWGLFCDVMRFFQTRYSDLILHGLDEEDPYGPAKMPLPRPPAVRFPLPSSLDTTGDLAERSDQSTPPATPGTPAPRSGKRKTPHNKGKKSERTKMLNKAFADGKTNNQILDDMPSVTAPQVRTARTRFNKAKPSKG